MDLLARRGVAQTPSAVEQCARGVRRGARLAEGGTAARHGPHRPHAGTNASTTWSPSAKSATPSPRATTSPAASCPSAIGMTRRPRAVDHREVGVAEPRGAHPDQQLIGPGWVELELSDLERPALGVGRGAPISRSTALLILTTPHGR